MIFSGNNIFNFNDQTNLSFNLNLNIDNNFTNFEFGLSGEGSESISFKNIDNNFYDPSGLLVYGISSGDILNVSGDINNISYSYFINSEPIFLNQNKTNFSINKFYFNTNHPVSGNLYIYGNTPSYQINFPSNFISGENITGTIYNNSLNKSFKIFDISGINYGYMNKSYGLKSNLFFLNKFTGVLNPQENINFYISTQGIDFTSIKNLFEIFVSTDFGDLSQKFTSDLIYKTYNFNFNPHFIYNSNANEILKNDTCLLNYESFDLVNNNKIFYDKPILISLEYYSGYTGNVSAIIKASGYKDVNLTGFLSGSGYLSAEENVIATGINLITNLIETGRIYQNFYDTNLTYLSGNLNQNIKINLSGYATGEFINESNFEATGDPTSIYLSNNFLSGLGYITGALYNYKVSGKYNNNIYVTNIPYINFSTGAYINGVVKQKINSVFGSGISTGYANCIFTGKTYVDSLGSGYIFGSGYLTGTNTSLIVTGKISGDLNDVQYTENIIKNIYGYKIATGILTNVKLSLTGYGLCTGNYIGTNNYGNIVLATGLNNFKASGFLNGTGLLTGYGTGILYDQYGSSGYNQFSGLKFYDANIEKVFVNNTDNQIADGLYLTSGLYNASFGPIGNQMAKNLYILSGNSNTFIRWTSASGWVFVKNNSPLYRSFDFPSPNSPVDVKSWYSYPGYYSLPKISGKIADYIDYNFSTFGTGYDLITGINLDYVNITSDLLEKNYVFNNITGSTLYYFNDPPISGTGTIQIFNNLDYSLNAYNITGIISDNIDTGIFYYTGYSSGSVPIFVSGQGTLYTSFGFPIITSITGIYNSGYKEFYAPEDSGLKILDINYNINSGSFAKNYSNLNVPPNLYFTYWQTDSSSFSSSFSPNGQFIYYNNISDFGAPLNTSGYVGDYHYIVYDQNSGWQIRRKSSNNYGWSGLKTINFPTTGWTGFNLSANRSPGDIAKIGFSYFGLKSTDPLYENRNYFTISDNLYNLNTLFIITGSGNSALNKTIIYSGVLKSGVGILPIVGTLTGADKAYITGFNRDISEIKSGLMFNCISLRPELQYNKNQLFGSGLFQTSVTKTGYYEYSGFIPCTGNILSQVEFTYSGEIDSYSGYLNGSPNRSLSNFEFIINNNSGFIQTGFSLKQDKSFAQDISGRIKNLLPLNLYPISDYSGYQDYILYATGFFKEKITGFANVDGIILKSGKFLTTGFLSGEFDVSYDEIDFGTKYVYQNITGVLVDSNIINTNIIVTGSSIGSGIYDNFCYATGSITKNISILPKVNVPIGSTITGVGILNLISNKNINFNVYSGLAFYQNNPYVENISGNLFTGNIDPFIATGNAYNISNKLLTGLISSNYTKTFLNSFKIYTGCLNYDGSISDQLNINQINLNKYSTIQNVDSGAFQINIGINKINHYNNDLIYAKLTLSGMDSHNNPSVIYEIITGGSF